jgi:NAD(P)-dependent dehydrogenase (short-subunit alcohol dehydrogenase family)
MPSEQKVAIVTGASQGIGAGAVQAYRKLGYAVVANSRHISSSADPGVLAVPGDVADPETGARLVDQAVEHFGRVDTLVNNAGVFVAKPFTDYTDADFDLVTGVNLRGFFSVTRQAIAAMLRNNGTRRGHVVNISTSLVDHANTARAASTRSPGRWPSSTQVAACASTRCRPASSALRCTPRRPTTRSLRCIRSAGWATSATS